jgi:diguanylate cyclase (GGDEF)-like protein/hemerythrin-like metal-binding protein
VEKGQAVSRESAGSRVQPLAAAEPLLEAFMTFPLPLALLDKDGRPELFNTRFLARFGGQGLDPVQMQALIREAALPAPTQERLVELGGEAPLRLLRTPRGLLLIAGLLADAEQGAAELEALRARVGDLERLAATDHLTGAWNRSHLDRIIESELARSQASHQPLSLILLDIDHFKRVNDTYGHAVGDSVLREMVVVVRGCTRAADLLFRWGGEEFVVLVPSAGHRHAAGVAEKLRQAVEGHVFPVAERVTISLGVAEHAPGEDVASWFQRLDASLYEAKRQGRNRVVVSPQGDSDVWAAQALPAVLHLEWQEAYECGDPAIDREHRELFTLGNCLIEAALRDPPEPDAVAAALQVLLTHVLAHFRGEEAILEHLRYAHLEEHRRAHAGLLRRALAMQADLAAGRAPLGAVIEFLVQDVVARHMLVVDRAYYPLLHHAVLPGHGPPDSQAQTRRT